jgi:hypothetical protein
MITNYQLEYSSDPNFEVSVTNIVNTGTMPNYTLTPAANGTIYYFRLMATNGRGDSPWSDPVQAIPYAPPSITSITPNTGLTLGNELITIYGDNLNSTYSVTIDGVGCVTFSVVDMNTINCMTPPNGVVGAKNVVVTNLGGSNTSVGGYTYGDPQLAINISKDLSINVDQLNVTKTDNHTVNAKTNDPRGYEVSISMVTNEQALVHTSVAGVKLNATNALVNAQPLPNDTWGYSLANPSSDSWLAVPASTNPRVIKSTTEITTGGMAGAGDDTVVYYGAKATMDSLAGGYAGTMVYTIVGNV